MDYSRKIGKPDKTSRILSKRQEWLAPEPCRNTIVDEPPKEDRRLANWRRWMQDRQRRQKYLSTVLGRDPMDLALNAHEKVRSRNETRCLMEAAMKTEITNQDKYRGNPAFWRTADHLIKNGENLEDDVIVNMDKCSKNLLPEVTRIALPDFIKKEKMLIDSCADTSKINLHSKWECSDYLQSRTSELKKEIEFLEPKRPESESLIVMGKNFQCGDQNQNFIRTPVITISPPKKQKKIMDDLDDIIGLVIEDREFVLEKGRHFEKLSVEETRKLQESGEDQNDKKYVYSTFEFDRIYKILPKKARSETWSLVFQTQGNEMCVRYLKLENRAVQTIKLHWRKKSSVYVPFPIPDRFDSTFFFNKNYSFILPGQKIEIPIWFHSERPITATETWNLIFDPSIYPGTLCLRLWAISHGNNWKLQQTKNYEKIKSYLSLRVRNSTIRGIIDELILTATSEQYVDDLPYDLFFLESDLFHARNPTYFYDSVLINDLKDLYKETTTKNDEWNLSLLNLRSAILQIDDPYERRDKLKRFQNIYLKCLRPTNLYTQPRISKNKQVHQILCTFFNKFENESSLVANSLFLGTHVESEDEEDESNVGFTGETLLMYREVFFVRIYCLLKKTIDRICVAIDSCNYYDHKDVD